MTILGIETSCDETSAAVIEATPEDRRVKLLSNIIASSLAKHSKTGGIIPEIAAREQVKYIIPVIKKSIDVGTNEIASQGLPLRGNNLTMKQFNNETIDAIAVTVGPGLIGSLLVGVETAKTLAYVWQKPIVPVNHLVGHIYANFINNEKGSIQVSLRAKRGEARQSQVSKIASFQAKPDHRNDKIIFPALALIASGGHADLVLLKNHRKLKWLGGTRDDAAGEAFDKIGRLLGLPYPSGPYIERAAKNGNPKAFNFPRPMIDSDNFDFSFSGLKTAVLREVKAMKQLNNETISNISASVQQAVIDVLVTKTLKAVRQYKVKSILLSGGVAANQKLRDEFKLNAKRYTLYAKIFAPQKSLCTDNAAMIATAAFFNYKPLPWQKITADPELYFD